LKARKILPLLSIFLLAFTSFFSNINFVSATSSDGSNVNTEQTLDKLREEQFSKESTLDQNDEVRIIVEVAGESPIEYATKQNSLYKELDESTKDELQSEAKSKQLQVQNTIKEKIDLKVVESFTTVVNGFSAKVQFKDIEAIRNLPNIEGVYISTKYNKPLPQPEMDQSHGFIQSSQTWGDANYKGEGTVISVIDSGVDPDHKDFNITDSSKVSLTNDKVQQVISENNLPGKYYNEKVPYGYNYYDKNQTILDIGPDASEHGMHVAGTTAANGEISGVAPEAQVLGMKVFSNDPNFPSTWEDIYLKAIDDSIKLDADVINMSLGSTAAFYQAENLADEAVTRAVNNGVVVSVSAGNSGHIGYGYPLKPFAENPDIGVVGSPGLSKDSIQVAASGNYTYLYETGITVGGVSATGYGADDWEEAFGETDLPLATIGGKVGHPEDYQGVDVEGKVVLVQRGELSFYDKSLNAKAAGAKGIIVYDNGTGSTFYKDQGGWGILPFMMIKYDKGVSIEEAISNGETTVDFETINKNEGPEVGKPTEFSSWGTTPSLELKPEITAPGGNILSTLNDNEYGYMSGTSMAAPHVSGGSALVQQYLKEDREMEGQDAARFAKVLLMNTADVIRDEYGQPFSPRRQGSGMMQTFSAVSTPVSVVEKTSGEAKVELFDWTKGQITKDSIHFTLKAENHSDERVHYGIDTSVLTDSEVNGTNLLIAGDTGAEVTVTGDVYDQTVTQQVYNDDNGLVTVTDSVYIEPNSIAELDFEIDLTTAKMPGTNGETTDLPLQINNFVEGFVNLTNLSTGQDLSVPYVGFYGNWDDPAIFDGNERSYYSLFGLPQMTDQLGYSLSPNGSGEFAISPNRDGYNDGIIPLPTFLRNARTAEFNILDESGKELRTIQRDHFVRKNYYDAGLGTPYSFDPARTWSGQVNFSQVPDGKYIYEMKAKVDYDDAKWQTKEIPVYVDTKAPEVNASFDSETNTLSWDTVENGSGVIGYDVYVDGVTVMDGLLSPDKTSYILDEGTEGTSVMVVAVDLGQNVGVSQSFPFDESEPIINLVTPEPLTEYGSQEILVSGTVIEPSALVDLKINGHTVDVQQNDNGDYVFETIVNYETDGTKEISVEATDYNGNNISITRTIFVDSTPGEIILDEEPPTYVESTVEQYELGLTLKDNYRHMDFYINDNYEYGLEFDVPLVMDGHEKQLTRKLDLQTGNNSYLLRLVDLGGNVTAKEVNIYKLAEGETPPEETVSITSLSTNNEELVSYNRPVTISGTANEEITWEVSVLNPNGDVVEEYTEVGTDFVREFTPEEFAMSGEYTVEANGVGEMQQPVEDVTTTFTVYNYSALITDVDVLNGSGEEQATFSNGANANIQAEILNLEGFSLSPMLILQVKDEEEAVVSHSYLNIFELYSDSKNGLGYEIDTDDLDPGTYNVEAFVWTGWDMDVLAQPLKKGIKFEVK